ncbi:MAG: hypothetical protein ACI4QM_00515, partial [Alphaproteobacteria bacterium]
RTCSGPSWVGNTCYNKQPNGTSCTGGTCSDGECVAGGCSSNSDCATNFFCADTNESRESAHPSICQKLNFTRRTITVNGTSETWYMPSDQISWWDAQSACDKIGKTMVTVGELVSGWSGSSGTFTRTERAQKLCDAIGGNLLVWTSDIVPSNSRPVVFLSDGYVFNYYRNNGHYFALCH